MERVSLDLDCPLVVASVNTLRAVVMLLPCVVYLGYAYIFRWARQGASHICTVTISQECSGQLDCQKVVPRPHWTDL